MQRVNFCFALFFAFFLLLFFSAVFAEKAANIASFELTPSVLIKSSDNPTPTFESIKVTVRKLTDSLLSGCRVTIAFTGLDGTSVASNISKTLAAFSGSAGETVAVEFLSMEIPGGISTLADGQYISIASLECDSEFQASESKYFSFSEIRRAIVPETNWVGVLFVVLGVLFFLNFAEKKDLRKFK